jgi:signal peptidase I
MTAEKVKKYLYKKWREWRLTIFIIVFVIIPVKSSLADWNWVPTGSMKPTILEGDLVFVNKAAYDLRIPLTMHRLARWSNPARGDIVICFSPDDGTRLVKRIIACPNDTIEMRNNVLFLNGEELDYSEIAPAYLKCFSDEQKRELILAEENLDGVIHPVMTVPSIRANRSFSCLTVPENCYFVMGDNRDLSKDSRIFGFVHRNQIVGKAKGVIISFDIKGNYLPRLKRFFSSIQ